MTKIKFSKNFFVTKIQLCCKLQCNLEHVYDALLVNGYGTATTKKENIGKIFAVACRCPAARSAVAERYTRGICSLLRVGSFHSQRVTVLNVSS